MLSDYLIILCDFIMMVCSTFNILRSNVIMLRSFSITRCCSIIILCRRSMWLFNLFCDVVG